MTPYFETESVVLYHGDCLAVMPKLPSGSVHAVVTDPPYCDIIVRRLKSEHVSNPDELPLLAEAGA